MKNYKSILNILEKILFVVLLVVVIVIASGYKYDPDRKELVQTGVLKIENLEDNTKLSFNNEHYDNRNNLSISLLEQSGYDLKISKTDRKDYLTKVQINPGEVTYINPVLIPKVLKPTLLRKDVQNIVYTDNSVFYTYEENNLIFLERLNLNKTLFNIDVNSSRIDITSLINKAEPISIYVNNGYNSVVLLNGSKVILADYNRLTVQDITSFLPLEKIVKLEIVNNILVIKYSQTLYAVNISNPQSIVRSLIYTGTNFLYDVDDNNNIIIFSVDTEGKNIIEYYNFSGALQNKLTLTTPIKSISDKSDFIYFYKNLYVVQGSTIYKLDEENFVEFLNNVQIYSKIDINNLLITTDQKAYILARDRMLVYDFNKSKDIQNIHILPDLFTYTYTDKDKNLHLADFGGQDNVLVKSLDDNDFIITQSGSDTYIAYKTGGQIEYIVLGNTKS